MNRDKIIGYFDNQNVYQSQEQDQEQDQELTIKKCCNIYLDKNKNISKETKRKNALKALKTYLKNNYIQDAYSSPW